LPALRRYDSNEGNVKYFLIKYQRRKVSEDEWHSSITQFIAALDGDTGLKGKIAYRCMKRRGGADYFHIAAAADDEAVKALQSRDYFARYTEQTKLAAGGDVEVLPLEIVAETRQRS
jgi:hypothetical protein